MSQTCAECGRPPTGKRYLTRGLCHRCYQRSLAIAKGIASVDPEAALKHLRILQERGLGYRKIAKAAGLAVSTLTRLPRRPVIDPATEKAILSIPVPEIDTAAVAHRELCIAGTQGFYVSLQRRFRPKFVHRRAQLLAERKLREQIRARREDRERQARAEYLNTLPPPVRVVSDLRCGDCEFMPCRCGDRHVTDDCDLWVINHLADNDPQPPVRVIEVIHA